MPPCLDPEALKTFTRRTQNIYSAQRKRAQRWRQQVPYGVEQLRDYARHRLWPPDGSPAPGCHYCGRPLTVLGFTLDHARPVSRGGAWELSNLVLCCGPCNESKGDLTEGEFHGLLALIDTWPVRARQSLLARLRGSWRIVKHG